MDIMVLVVGIVIAVGMFMYFFVTYRNQRLTPDRMAKLKKEFYDALIEGGVKQVYNGLDDVMLLDEYKALEKKVLKKGQIVKYLELECKKDIIQEIFKERGIELA